MKIEICGNLGSPIVLVQVVMEQKEIQVNNNYMNIGVIVDDWNQELSPWCAKAVFGKQDFGDGAIKTLHEIEKVCNDHHKKYLLCGYSLAGLFSLWCACQTNRFEGIVACSPSVWFPGFVSYLKENPLQTKKVYLSLGKQESKTRNQIMSTVSECIKECEEIIRGQDIPCVLEWNPGNHFTDPNGRVKKGIDWVLK